MPFSIQYKDAATSFKNLLMNVAKTSIFFSKRYHKTYKYDSLPRISFASQKGKLSKLYREGNFDEYLGNIPLLTKTETDEEVGFTVR